LSVLVVVAIFNRITFEFEFEFEFNETLINNINDNPKILRINHSFICVFIIKILKK